MFNSKYPIVAVGMNQVSDLNLALAVSRAGAVPTLSIFNYATPSYKLDIKSFEQDLLKFRQEFPIEDLILTIDDKTLLLNLEIIDILINFKIRYIELIRSTSKVIEPYIKNLKEKLKKLQSNDVNIIGKVVHTEMNKKRLKFEEYYSILIIKGSNGAGRISEKITPPLSELTEYYINKYHDKKVIPSGGVSSSTDVKELISIGAAAVGIGSLFAAAEESCLSTETKNQIVKSNLSQLQTIDTFDLPQKALVFSDMDQTKWNNTEGLISGIKTGTEGHIFMGSAIDRITEIRSVNDIIQDLCSLL